MNKIMGILFLLVYVCIATAILSDGRFLMPDNIQNVFRRSALFGIIGIGAAFVIITGGIDLSVGSLIGLVGCLLPMFLTAHYVQQGQAVSIIRVDNEQALVTVAGQLGWLEKFDQLAYVNSAGNKRTVTVKSARQDGSKTAIVIAGNIRALKPGIELQPASMSHMNIGLAIVLVMLVSLGCGLLHGLLITKVKLQPFVVTLCGLLFYRGFARWISGDQTKGFGEIFRESLNPLATGKPISLALLMVLAGLLLAGWLMVRIVRQRRQRIASPIDSQHWFFLAMALMMMLVGGSRFLQLNDSSVIRMASVAKVTVYVVQQPDGELRIDLTRDEMKLGRVVDGQLVRDPGPAGLMPQILLSLIGYLAIPAFLLSVFVVMRIGRRARELIPVGSVLLGALLVIGAIGLMKSGGSWAGPAWTPRMNMMTVLASLVMFVIAISYFARQGLKVAGSAVQLPLVVTGVLGICWLMGRIPLGQTLVPAPLITLLVLAGLAAIFLNQTIYGRYLLALGRNEDAARYSGIRTDRMVILAYVICSGAAGVAGILFALDINSVQPSGHGNFYELYAIAAAVLGGCSLRGGEGSIVGVIIGAAVIQVLYNSIILLSIPSQLEFAIIGLVILAGVVTDELVKRYRDRRRAIEEAAAASVTADENQLLA
jgi:ribose/xylose/arabinose/galactoside ABC-type transport system permease subunit